MVQKAPNGIFIAVCLFVCMAEHAGPPVCCWPRYEAWCSACHTQGKHYLCTVGQTNLYASDSCML